MSAKIKRNRVGFVRFRDLKWTDINCDLHVHTSRTDGQADVKTILERAVEHGLGRIGFTEHVRKDTRWFKDFASEVRNERLRYPKLDILIGCETKALDANGTLDVNEEILAECEIVLGSVHRFPDGSGGYLDFASIGKEYLERVEYEMSLGLLKTAPIDVLAHPAGMYMRYYSDFSHDLMREIFKTSLQREIAIEINSSYIQNIPAYIKLCNEVNPYVSVGSDVHEIGELSVCRDKLRTYGVASI